MDWGIGGLQKPYKLLSFFSLHKLIFLLKTNILFSVLQLPWALTETMAMIIFFLFKS